MILCPSSVGETFADTSSLPDSPTLERDLADDRRAAVEAAAASFDPENLYADEQARDFAVSLLAETFPDLDVSIYVVRTVERDKGKWSRRSWWNATANDSDNVSDCVVAGGINPAEAAQGVIKAWRKAHGRIRPHPEYSEVVAGGDYEAFGRINPADGAECLRFVTDRIGVAYPLHVESDGRVLLQSDYVSGGEAYDIGQAIADFIHERTPGAAEAESAVQIVVDEPQPNHFKGHVVLANGERIGVPGVCPTREAAQSWAERAKRAMRSTIAARAVAEVTTVNTAA